ncbi:MAG: hypothetical protein JWL88_124 [Parcubacteria group bacterium]|nr:hypothetical protein [Parcubacteria group bacterium]
MPVKTFREQGLGNTSLGLLETQIRRWEMEENSRRKKDPEALRLLVTSATQSHPTPDSIIITIFYQ